MSALIRVGTASWSDPGFIEDWYPPGLPKSQLLSWYASNFDFVEVNSTFYSIPDVRVVEGWCRQTPDGFLFDVKLFKLLSRHSTESKFLPPDLRVKAGSSPRAALTRELEALVAQRFLREIQPLVQSGKLGALLLQLSPSFRPVTNDLNELDNLFGIFSKHRLAVELRNRDWMVGDQLNETVEFFRSRGVTLVTVDAPESEHFTVMPFSDVTTNRRLAYWRLHGRNEDAFVKGRTVAERFNYQYSTAELEEIERKIQEIAPNSEELHLVFNNNRSNYAPKAAAQLMEMIQKNRTLRISAPKQKPKIPRQSDLKLGT